MYQIAGQYAYRGKNAICTYVYTHTHTHTEREMGEKEQNYGGGGRKESTMEQRLNQRGISFIRCFYKTFLIDLQAL